MHPLGSRLQVGSLLSDSFSTAAHLNSLPGRVPPTNKQSWSAVCWSLPTSTGRKSEIHSSPNYIKSRHASTTVELTALNVASWKYFGVVELVFKALVTFTMSAPCTSVLSPALSYVQRSSTLKRTTLELKRGADTFS